MSSSFIDPIISTAATPSPAAASGGSSANALASKDMFLQLLVAQLKYQDPENPADGTQFVTQLAQFSQLEQATQMVSDLDSIKTLLTGLGTTAPAANGNPPPGAAVAAPAGIIS
jgi:flagellar basal-body rod modification protein FlgD